MNFDGEDVLPFLERLASIVNGISQARLRSIAAEIESMRVDTERDWTVEVEYLGTQTRLRIHAFKDDVDAPDLYFFSREELIKRVEDELGAFASERGL